MLKKILVAATILAFLSPISAAEKITPAPLLARINQVIDKVHHRPLHSNQHTPWVIMHAVVAFEQNIDVTNSATGEKLNAIDYLLTEATFNGKRIYRDDNGIPRMPTRDITPGYRRSFELQDHVDQYLFAYADAHVPLTRKLITDNGKTYQLQDKLNESRAGFTRSQELGWTLVVLSSYQPFDYQWKTRRGVSYRIEDVMKIALTRDPRRETEGGSHHIYGIAYCLDHYLQQGGKLDGVWADARTYLDKYTAKAKAWQQKDGEFSAGVFRHKRASQNPEELVSITGHFLEWMSIAMTKEQLQEQWVTRAVERLVTAMEQHPLTALSDGGIYHAAHALIRYRDKVY